MLDLIFAFKFVHVLAAATMFGVWLCLAIVMLLGHRSRNPSVVAVTAQFVVGIEKSVMIAVILVQPISGFPLAWTIGLYAVVVACWLAAFRIETRIRRLSRHAVLTAAPLPDGYGRLFRGWLALAVVLLLAMSIIFALMVWQPRLD